MELQVEIISTQHIKPSTPTPPHLKYYKLSLVDQLTPWIYTPSTFFYSPPTSTSPTYTLDIATRLKDALSRVLSVYYPIAGRITADESAVECNDDGVPFIEARPNCTLSEFLGAPNKLDLLKHLYPINETIALGANSRSTFDDKERSEIVKKLVHSAVQLNIFECGGVAISHFGLHKLFDGNTAGMFFRSWAALACGGSDAEVPMMPDFETAIKTFPPIRSEDVPKRKVPLTLWPSEDGECIVKPFVFSAKAITALREKAKSEEVPEPTRIEAVSAFIWKHTMAAAANGSSTSPGPSLLSSLVNIRPHTNPPLPSTSVGNMFMHAISYLDGSDDTTECKDLVINIRRAIFKTKDAQYLGGFLGEEGTNALLESRKKDMELYSSNTNMNWCKITCWGNFDMDFGFGKPVWTGMIGGKLDSYFRNLVPLVKTLDNGIEAWMIFNEQDMKVLESDPEFLAYASPSGPN